MRVPWQFFVTIAERYDLDICTPGVVQVPVSPTFLVGSASSNSDPVLYCLESLLCRKVGLADHLLAGTFSGSARLATMAVDDVPDPHGGGQSERTAMLTMSLDVEAGLDALPASTGAYSKLIWADAAVVGTALRSHDALLLDDTLDPFEVCIAGLCIRSAVDLIDSE